MARTKALAEMRMIHEIANRAVKLAKTLDTDNITFIDMTMDIACVHELTPLRLEELLNADNGNFGHDVFGIRRYLNRATRQLEDCFAPRFTASAQTAR